jgi:hypothetical protein
MECLRRTSIEGRDGVLVCEFKACSFKFIPHVDDQIASERSEIATLFLQAQLERGSPENSNNRPCLDRFME